MPELPEVETTVRGLERYLVGAHLARVIPRRAGLRRPFPPDLVQVMTGALVTGLARRGKYGVIHGDRGQSLVFHLGMSGSWRIEPAELGRHDHLVLHTTSGHSLALCDPRRFGSVDLVETARLAEWPIFTALGPEPLDEGLNPVDLAAALAGRSRPIKLALLDQRIVAGLGNIYVCEALFRAKIAPGQPAGALDQPALTRLVMQIKAVLAEAIAAGGSTLRDFAQVDGQLGYFFNQFAVYERAGQPCPRCQAPIVRIAQGGRGTWFCQTCQQ